MPCLNEEIAQALEFESLPRCEEDYRDVILMNLGTHGAQRALDQSKKTFQNWIEAYLDRVPTCRRKSSFDTAVVWWDKYVDLDTNHPDDYEIRLGLLNTLASI
jgi:hypothetical protein